MDSTPNDTVFRTREAPARPEKAPQEAPTKELTDSGNFDKAITPNPEFSPASELEEYEIKNGKYGLEYLGIKEVVREFPYKMQFSTVDNYIKDQIIEKGYAKTTENYQEILNEIEKNIGTQKLDRLERLNKLFKYVKVVKRIDSAKKIKQEYENYRDDRQKA